MTGNKWKWWQPAVFVYSVASWSLWPWLLWFLAGKCCEKRDKFQVKEENIKCVDYSQFRDGINISLMWVIIYICGTVIPKLFDCFPGKSAVGKSKDLEGSRNKWQLGWHMVDAKKGDLQLKWRGIKSEQFVIVRGIFMIFCPQNFTEGIQH